MKRSSHLSDLASFIFCIVIALYMSACAVGGAGSNNPGLQPAIQTSPSSVSFGQVTVGSLASQMVEIMNTGNAALSISSASITSGGSNFSISGSVRNSLPPGATTNVSIVFSPTAAGSVSGTLTIASNAPTSPTLVSLSGTGVQPAIQVTVSPAAATLMVGTSQQFTAAVSGTSDQRVTWLATGGGTITASGLYTAPATISGSSISVRVTATSVADPSKSGSAQVTVTAAPPPVSVSVSPASITLNVGQSQQFTATVTGSSNTSVTWSLSPQVGTITAGGLYMAPSSVTTQTTVIVTATSNADPSKLASATVTVIAPGGNFVSSITKDGITWTFSQPVLAGQFVNGDYYVIGLATVTSISPAPTASAPYRNGSVLNLHSFNDRSGFDDRTQGSRFDASMRVYPPINLRPGDALVSSISVDLVGSFRRVMRALSATASPVRTVSILTVLDRSVAPDAFRPSYCDRNQTIYLASNLQRNLLPSLPRVASTPTLAEFEGYFRRPWIDVNQFLFDPPIEYMPDYGREVGFAVSYASLLLMQDFPPQQKENLTNYLVQYGVDLFGCLEAGYIGWPAWGGHGNGRKFPIVFAGLLLNQARMQQVGSLYPDKFGEDMHTIYVNETPPAGTYQRAWQGATVVYSGHLGINGGSVNPGWGPYEHLQPRDWINTTGEDYRRCCTSVTWVGQALALRLLRAEPIWNHSAFLDYADRWMFEDDTQAVADIKAQIGTDYSANWMRQGQTRFFLQGSHPNNTFIDDMWQAYR